MRTAEFRRNLWLELSLQRLIVLVVIVGVLVLLSEATKSSGVGSLADVGSWLFYLTVFLWGSRRAAAAMTEEVNGGTWAGQRLSALPPAALVFGKLFGATAFVWVAGLIGIGLYVTAWVSSGLPLDGLLPELVKRLASGVLLHAVAIATTLLLLNKRAAVVRLGNTFAQLLALAAGIAMVGLFESTSPFFMIAGRSEIVWYGAARDTTAFFSLIALTFAFWAVLACLRLMAVQLQRRPLPWAWPAFSIYLIALVQGFVGGPDFDAGKFGPFTASFGVAVILFYLALFAERNEPLRYRQCFAAFREGKLRRGLSLLPWWLFSLAILLAVTLWGVAGEAMDSARWEKLGAGHMTVPPALVVGLGFVAFAVRDAAFVLWINAGRGRNGDLAAFIYLLVLYGPVLALFAAMRSWQAIGVVSPLPFGVGAAGLGAGLAQAAVFGFLTWRRWQALFRS